MTPAVSLTGTPSPIASPQHAALPAAPGAGFAQLLGHQQAQRFAAPELVRAAMPAVQTMPLAPPPHAPQPPQQPQPAPPSRERAASERRGAASPTSTAGQEAARRESAHAERAAEGPPSGTSPTPTQASHAAQQARARQAAASRPARAETAAAPTAGKPGAGADDASAAAQAEAAERARDPQTNDPLLTDAATQMAAPAQPPHPSPTPTALPTLSNVGTWGAAQPPAWAATPSAVAQDTGGADGRADGITDGVGLRRGAGLQALRGAAEDGQADKRSPALTGPAHAGLGDAPGLLAAMGPADWAPLPQRERSPSSALADGGVAPLGAAAWAPASGAAGGVIGGVAGGAGMSEAAAPAPLYVATLVDSPEFPKALGTHISVLVRDGLQQAELHLNPAEMGPISIQIALEGTQAQVDFGAASAATREIIENGLPELASALRDAGFTLSGGGVHQHSAGQRQGQPEGRAHPGASNLAQAPDAEKPQPSEGLRARVSVGGVDLYA